MFSVLDDLTPRPRIIRRRGRKIKIVPVDETPTASNASLHRKTESDNVCVLFTNYTMDGCYINDHDYLVAPYRRNKILVRENSTW